jgi:hypothetical protein
MQKREPPKSVLQYSSDPVRPNAVTFGDVIRGTFNTVLGFCAVVMFGVFVWMGIWSITASLNNHVIVLLFCGAAAYGSVMSAVKRFAISMRAFGGRKDPDP